MEFVAQAATVPSVRGATVARPRAYACVFAEKRNASLKLPRASSAELHIVTRTSILSVSCPVQ